MILMIYSRFIVTSKIMENGLGAIFLKIIGKNGPKTYSIILGVTINHKKSILFALFLYCEPFPIDSNRLDSTGANGSQQWLPIDSKRCDYFHSFWNRLQGKSENIIPLNGSPTRPPVVQIHQPKLWNMFLDHFCR